MLPPARSMLSLKRNNRRTRCHVSHPNLFTPNPISPLIPIVLNSAMATGSPGPITPLFCLSPCPPSPATRLPAHHLPAAAPDASHSAPLLRSRPRLSHHRSARGTPRDCSPRTAWVRRVCRRCVSRHGCGADRRFRRCGSTPSGKDAGSRRRFFSGSPLPCAAELRSRSCRSPSPAVLRWSHAQTRVPVASPLEILLQLIPLLLDWIHGCACW